MLLLIYGRPEMTSDRSQGRADRMSDRLPLRPLGAVSNPAWTEFQVESLERFQTRLAILHQSQLTASIGLPVLEFQNGF